MLGITRLKALYVTRQAMRNLHRFIFWSLLLAATIWELIALRINPSAVSFDLKQAAQLLKANGIAVASIVFWPMAYLLLVDYLHSRLGKNGRHFQGYARPLQKDLIVAGLTALLLASIYGLDSVSYGFSGIDIAFVGVPFLVNALYTLIQCTRASIAGQPVRKCVLLLVIGLLLAYTTIIFWFLVKNSSGELKTDQALFLQLSILFSGLSFFLGSHYILYCLTKGRVEASPFLINFFSEIVESKSHDFIKLAAKLESHNQHLEHLKSENAAAVRRRQKNGRKPR